MKLPTKTAFLIAIAAAIFSLLPTIWAGIHTPQGMWFTGVSSYFDPWDINTYFAAMRQGFGGSLLFRDPYNPTSNRAPLHLIYLLLGHLARVLHLSVPTTFYSAGFVLGVVFLLAVYFFVRHFLHSKFWGLVCLYLVAFGGGFGGLVLFQGQLLPDTAYPDVTVFPTLHLPHFILDEFLFLGVLFLSYLALTQHRWRYGLAASFLGGLLSFIHPYSLFVADVVLGVFLTALYLKDKDWRRVRFLLPLAFVGLSAACYFFGIFYRASGHPLKISSSSQFATPSPVTLFLGYGLVAALALKGAYHLWKEKEMSYESLFLLSWFLGHFSVLYLPISWQRIMIKSFFVVLCLLAVVGMRALDLRKDLVALVAILVLSSLTNLSIQYFTIVSTPAKNPWAYLSLEKFEVLGWLRNNAPGRTILAPPLLSTIIPANSQSFVYLGYQDVKSDLVRTQMVENFYNGTLSSPKEFLHSNRISYIIFINDRGGFSQKCQDYLLEVYRNDKTLVCQTGF